jgi:hypothetical protein
VAVDTPEAAATPAAVIAKLRKRQRFFSERVDVNEAKVRGEEGALKRRALSLWGLVKKSGTGFKVSEFQGFKVTTSSLIKLQP